MLLVLLLLPFLTLHFVNRIVLKLCDENDKAKDLNDYFKNTLQNHIKNTTVPALKKLKEETLLAEFVK